MEPANGSFLIANPHLLDPNFLRTVVFLCEHNSEGSFGFVMNRKMNFQVGDLVPALAGFDFPVFEGGPVELNSLHFLHQYPDALPGGKEVAKGVYWGGDFEQLTELVLSGTTTPQKLRFFLGYSGWGAGQLNFEMEEKTWIVAPAKASFIFQEDGNQLWKEVLRSLGGDFELIVNAPIDPRMN